MRILSIDCETDGLYGVVWAIGAVVYDDDPEVASDANGIVSRFGSMVDRPVETGVVTDEWVIDNVVPHVHLFRVPTRAQLYSDFARWWNQERRADPVAIADVGVPVEAGLFRALWQRSLIGDFDGPYPLHEVATMLLAAGIDPDVDRVAFAGLEGLTPHDPTDDAYASLFCWLKSKGLVDARAEATAERNRLYESGAIARAAEQPQYVREVINADAFDDLAEAIRLTEEYSQLPAIPGWTWFDAFRRYKTAGGSVPWPGLNSTTRRVPQLGGCAKLERADPPIYCAASWEEHTEITPSVWNHDFQTWDGPRWDTTPPQLLDTTDYNVYPATPG